ncbi:MAG TPA: UPF0182 family protein [Candidatus Limnocylindria bacterium]|nr:UPF0182 family protein [Candidatus Limnocylindria bacterium]
MGDLFDDFMKELRRRQDEASGRRSGDRPDERPEPPDDDESGDDAGGPPPAGPEPTPLRRPRRGPGRSRGRGIGGRGPREPRRVGGPDDGGGRPGYGRTVGLAVVGAIILAVIVLGGTVVTFWTDAMWFKSVGYDAVFWTRVLTRLGLFVGTLAVALAILLVNLWLAGRAVPPRAGARVGVREFLSRMAETAGATEGRRPGDRYGNGDDRPAYRGGIFGDPRRSGTRSGPDIDLDEIPDLTPVARLVLVVLAVIIALSLAGSVSARWETIQLWAHHVPFSPAGPGATVDPIFSRDIGFFLFDLPFLRLVQSVVSGVLIASLVLVGGRFAVAALDGAMAVTTRVRVHLAVLGGLLLIVVAAGYQLDKLELVYSTRGVATGVSYTDQHAQFLAFDVLTVIAALAGAFLVGAAFTRWVWPLGVAVAAWLVASFVLGSIYPELVQRFSVLPNQFAVEEPYIGNNIRMTRLAFGLEGWDARKFGGEAPLTAATIAQEDATFKNARLWDYRPLGDTLDQLQTIRQYYDFTDIDTDRYQVAGDLRQVMLGARELAPDKNPQANSWVNQRITFTHGIGVAMVPVNEATPGGLPQLIIRDLPPVSTAGAPAISEPRIYFGERDSDYIIVNARQAAFDYPVGSDANAEGRANAPAWTGTSGIRLDTTLTKLLFSARFTDLNLLISDQITADSQLLFHRSLRARLEMVAPFLRLDKDPYLVVTASGRLVYIQDAYTISDRFPNAQPFDGSTLGESSGLAGDTFNYIRNSVKIVMDAYDGTMTLYAMDPNDPILRAYEGVFPTLFTPADRIPADLVPHLRVPEEFFNVQTRQFATYHVTNPSSFYSNNDLWTVPSDPGGTQSLPSEAYYVVMRMPGEPDPEFLLLQPMVPKQRLNMIAWVAARNDPAHYGGVRVYQFPQDTTVIGPNQIAAKIDAEPTISSQISLWDAAGSKVIKGNLIVLPVQDSLIYLQPIYLKSTNAAFPQLEKIVIASPTTVVWGDTLDEALRLLLAGGFGGGGATPTPRPSASPGATATPAPSGGPIATPPADIQALVDYANEHFQRAEAALRAGDFATYGQEIALVQDALERLDLLVNSSAPPASSAPPGASPSP